MSVPFEKVENNSLDIVDLILFWTIGCSVRMAWMVLMKFVKLLFWWPERCTYYMPNETDDQKVKNIENLLSHVVSCKLGMKCWRDDCSDFKLDLHDQFYNDDDDEDDTSSSSDSDDDNEEDLTSASSDGSCSVDSDDESDSSESSYDSKERTRCYDSYDRFKNYRPYFDDLTRSIESDSDWNFEDKSYRDSNSYSKDDQRIEETAVRNGINETKRSYSDIFGVWRRLSEFEFKSLINMLYNSENWTRPNADMIRELSRLFFVPRSTIETWFKIKRSVWRQKVRSGLQSSRKNDDLLNTGSSIDPENISIGRLISCEVLIDAYRAKPFLDFLFKSKNWKCPTDHMLKVLKVVTGRKCRVLRELFNKLAYTDDTVDTTESAQSSSNDASDLTSKKMKDGRLQVQPAVSSSAAVPDESPNNGQTYSAATIFNNSSGIQTTADERTLNNSALPRDFGDSAANNANVVDDKLSVNERGTSDPASTSKNSASVTQTIADESVSNNSTSSEVPGASVVNHEDGSRRPYFAVVADAVLIICFMFLFHWNVSKEQAAE